MNASLALLHGRDGSPLDRVAAFQALREMVLNSVASEYSKRNYAKALDEVFGLCEQRKQPLSRALLMEYRAAMLEKKLSASTVNVRLSAVRKLIGEAQRNGIIGAEEADLEHFTSVLKRSDVPKKTVDIFVDAFDPMAKRIAQMQNRAMTVTDKV